MFYKYHSWVCRLDLSFLSHVWDNGGDVIHTGLCCRDNSLHCVRVIIPIQLTSITFNLERMKAFNL